jgi:arginine deiminase
MKIEFPARFVSNTFVRFLFLLAIIAVAVQAGQVSADEKVGSKAEWHPAKMILMHTPGNEIFLGVVHPSAALFEKPFSLKQAASQHLKYIEELEKQGIKVHTVVDVLLKGTVDADDRAVPGKELDQLQEFAKGFLTIDTSRLPPEIQVEQEKYKAQTIAKLNPRELVQIILMRPTVHLEQTKTNTGFKATYEVAPVMNLYFCRDQMITTAKGVVLSRMNSPQRAVEIEIIRFTLNKLNISPIYEVSGEGRLEGGDYFSAGDTAFIGQGLRTNAEGIRQLLDNNVFGLPRVVVVKDEWENQEEMHLDTYFNIIDRKLAVLVDMRMDLPGKSVAKGMAPKVDVYELENGRYVKKISNVDFQEYMEKNLGYTLIPVSRKDQNLYGINFLTIRPNRIMAIEGVSDGYKKLLKKNGVSANWMDFSALTSGYGAAHCTTQVLLRERP